MNAATVKMAVGISETLVTDHVAHLQARYSQINWDFEIMLLLLCSQLALVSCVHIYSAISAWTPL